MRPNVSHVLTYAHPQPYLTGNSSSQLLLRSCKFSTLLKPLDRFRDLALLEAQLGGGGDSDIAFFVNLECFLAQGFGGCHVLLPLENGERLVDERQDVGGRPERKIEYQFGVLRAAVATP